MGGVSGAEVNERSSEDGDIARAREGGYYQREGGDGVRGSRL